MVTLLTHTLALHTHCCCTEQAGMRESITVRWWNFKRSNSWKLDPPEQKSVVLVATIHRDGTMFEMERIGKTQLWRVMDEGAFDRLHQTYGIE